MEEFSKAYDKNLLAEISQTLILLTDELAKQSSHLVAQNASMEELTEAIRQLEATIKKDDNSACAQPSLELKETMEAFVENTINQRYYRGMRLLKLNSGLKETESGSDHN